jgi:hypothetical protein
MTRSVSEWARRLEVDLEEEKRSTVALLAAAARRKAMMAERGGVPQPAVAGQAGGRPLVVR